MNYDLTQWFLNPLAEFVNKRFLVESFVGQELLAYADPYRKQTLFYLHRETRTSQAEVDYVIQERDAVVPIEVKSSLGTSSRACIVFLKAMQLQTMVYDFLLTTILVLKIFIPIRSMPLLKLEYRVAMYVMQLKHLRRVRV